MLRFKVDIALAREGELMLQGWAFGSNPEEEVKLTVGSVQSLGHVHNLSTQWSHTGTTTNPDHLLARGEVRMEVTVRTTHHYLVAWLQREDVR